MGKHKKILFGVLNWGLGHATRSIPLIRQCLNQQQEVVIASDGEALKLLRKEFPQLEFEELPGYRIRYSKKPEFFTLKLLSQMPHILKTMRQERQITRRLVDKHQAGRIISDNRFGFRDERIKSVYITHQLRVLSGFTTPLTSYLHRLIYDKFDEIWVPDHEQTSNLSGKLGHLNYFNPKVKYIGVISRFQKRDLPEKYDILAILSGPEPQRSLLEEKLLKEMSRLDLKTSMVLGKVEARQSLKQINGIDVYNFLTAGELQNLINASGLIISRPGYTSVMDLVFLGKKVLWIPTPGQREQEYLARYLSDQYGFEFQSQKHLDLKRIL